MRILLIGAGGVGDAVAKIAAKRGFYEHIVVSDYDQSRADKTIAWIESKYGAEVAARFSSAKIDASNAANIAALITQSKADHDPFHKTGIKLGDAQYALNDQWQRAGKLALVGIGVEPGLSNIFAKYAADQLFSEIDEVSVKDGGNLEVRNEQGEVVFAPSFSIWTTIEECLNPPTIYEKRKGWFTTQPFSEPEVFEFPEGIGSVECVNVEHEEITMLPRTMNVGRVTFKYGLGTDFINVLKTLHRLGLDATKPVRVRSAQGPVEVAPRDVVVSVLPDPATIGPQMTGKTCAGVLVTGKSKDGTPRATYIYHVADNAVTMAEIEAQAVVAQTAFNPVIALELIASGIWQGVGVMGPEEFDPKPFLDLMSSSTGYQEKWVAQERLAASPLRHP